MTVSKLRIWQGQQEAVCDWFEGTKQHDGSFPVTSLKIVTEDHGGSAEARPSGGGPHSWMR